MELLEKVEGVAKIIGMSPSLVKKYYLLFEEEGIKFKRSQEGHLLFSNHDIDLFKELIQLKNQKGMTVSKAVKQIVVREVITDTTDITDITSETGSPTTDITVMAQQVTTVMAAITDMTKQVTTVMTDMAELKALYQKEQEENQQLREYIKNIMEEDLKQRQHDRELIYSLRDSMQQRKLEVAAASEAMVKVAHEVETTIKEVAAASEPKKPKKKKGFWAWLSGE